MTFETAAWAINGPILGSSLARRAVYASGAKQSGIVQSGDLKVTQLGVPGVGVQIAPGVGLVLNGYQATPNEAYVVSNPGVHTMTSGEMPAANVSAKSYLVCIVIGDPDFSQAGHPWMPSSGVPDGEESTFIYVRPTIIEVAAGATTAPAGYPALVLARIDVPANTTTITDAMITDLRTLSQPRNTSKLYISGNAWAALTRYVTTTAYADWGQAEFAPQIAIPSWATRADIVAQVDGIGIVDPSVNITGNVRFLIGPLGSAPTSYDLPVGGGAMRYGLSVGGSLDVSALAGTTQTLKLQAQRVTPAQTASSNQAFRLQSGSSVIFDVRFYEK